MATKEEIRRKKALAGTPGYDRYGEKTGGAGSLQSSTKSNNAFEKFQTRKAREGKGNRRGNVNSGNQTLEQMGLGDPMQGYDPVYRGPTAEEQASLDSALNPKVKKTTPKKTTPRKKVNTVQGRKKVGSANAGIKSSGTTIKDFAKKEKDSRTITGQILTGAPKKRTEGEIRTRKQNQNRIDGGGLNSYKQGSKRANYNAVSKEELANMTPQQRRIAKRTNRRLDRKEGRKNDRARNVAIRRGLSPQQAKDFMQNRRNRLNQAMGEFGKGLMGREQNLSNIDKRLYRKKGTGTLQNMKAEDGSTYDATAPYQGVGPNRTGRGLKKTYYDGLIKTKPLALDPTIKLKDPQNDTETKDKTTKTIENNLEGNKGNNLATKLYSDMPPAERAAARAYNKSEYGTLNPTAEGKADNTFTYKDGERAQGLEKYNESLRKAAGINSPTTKLDDRSTMQGNMSSIKGRRG